MNSSQLRKRHRREDESGDKARVDALIDEALKLGAEREAELHHRERREQRGHQSRHRVDADHARRETPARLLRVIGGASFQTSPCAALLASGETSSPSRYDSSSSRGLRKIAAAPAGASGAAAPSSVPA